MNRRKNVALAIVAVLLSPLLLYSLLRDCIAEYRKEPERSS